MMEKNQVAHTVHPTYLVLFSQPSCLIFHVLQRVIMTR